MTTMCRGRDEVARTVAGLLALCVALVLMSCSSDLSSVRCVSNSECASNRCSAGRCVPTDGDATGDDVDTNDVAEDVADDAADDVGADAADVDDDVALDVGADVALDGDTSVDVAADALVDADVAADTTDDADVSADVPTDADVDAAVDAPDVPDVPVDPALDPPTGLQASDGTDAAVVHVTWDTVSRADGYRVFRDGTALGDVTSASFDDTGAARGVPAVPGDLVASVDDPFAVHLDWAESVGGAAGSPHVYTVATLRAATVSVPSAPDAGYTSAGTVTGYDVMFGDEVVGVEDGRAWADGAAPAPGVAVDAVSVARVAGEIRVSAVGAVRVPGAPRSYAVRARTAAGGISAWTEPVQGRRTAGPLSFSWERSSADADAAYGAFATTDVPSAVDPAGPPAGSARYYRVVVDAFGAPTATSPGVRFARPLDPPSAPTGLAASDGTSVGDVAVTWSAVAGATGYDVYRDDVLVGADVTGTSWADTGASPGGAPLAPTGVAASTTRPDDVEVTWRAALAGGAGTSHTYAVAARNGAGAGPRSATDVGYRAAPSVAAYEISIDGGAWFNAGSGAAWNDAAATAPAIVAGVASASDGTSTGFVALTLAGTSTRDGDARSYAVRAVASDGRTGAASGSASGQRAPGALTYAWQRSAGPDASGFSTLGGATGTSFQDTTAPDDGSVRYYRCEISATGADTVLSNADAGYRSDSPGDLGDLCAGNTACLSNNCANGHCAPTGFSYAPAGTFVMGEDASVVGGFEGETPHNVTLSHAFFVQTTEVTQRQFRDRLGTSPSSFSSCGDTCPVDRVNWWDALLYANALSAFEGLTPCYVLSGCSGGGAGCGADIFCSADTCASVSVNAPGGDPYQCVGYRLPTEAEWEYAARAGTTTSTWAGDLTANDCSDTVLPGIAWFCGNASSMPHPSATRAPNPWGLYDMLGNAFEWVWDFNGSYGGDVTDPVGPPTGSYHIVRGGAWSRGGYFLRAASRSYSLEDYRVYDLGFRVVRTAP